MLWVTVSLEVLRWQQLVSRGGRCFTKHLSVQSAEEGGRDDDVVGNETWALPGSCECDCMAQDSSRHCTGSVTNQAHSHGIQHKTLLPLFSQ